MRLKTNIAIQIISHSRSLEMAPFDKSHTSFYSFSIVTVAVPCIVSEAYWSKIVIFSYPLVHNNPWGKRLSIFFTLFFLQPDPWLIRWCKKILQTGLCLLPAHARHRQTDGRTDRQTDGNAISIAERLLRSSLILDNGHTNFELSLVSVLIIVIF